MPGVVFLIVVPTANFERQLLYGGLNKWDTNNDTALLPHPQYQTSTISHNNQLLQPSSGNINTIHDDTTGHIGGPQNGSGVVGSSANSGNNLNITLPDNNTNALLRLEVELRDKNAPKNRKGYGRGGGGNKIPITTSNLTNLSQSPSPYKKGGAELQQNKDINVMVPMEKVLEELLFKLEIDHVTWSSDKRGYYYHVVFPLPAGEPCETTLHCLTELGIGTKFNSSVSVLPCSVSYDAISDAQNKDTDFSDENEEQLSKWNEFVESIKSKLTVKQVVDGVRAGGSLSFDYLLLIVTADSLAALGLVENNAPNIVAAMLVSPLMGPVMSITFGTIISDRELVRVGFISLALGMFISMVFGFIFGLILGTTEMPWGFGDWPTEEMKGRGNYRSLWMGVLWALTSGTGVAVALLQGSAGPLIGVAISASLLPPVVNCGLFWALACIWLIYPGIKMPHIKGEAYVGNSTYEFIYTQYIPTEFFINGIVSGLLTVVNVICIFITAIIVLKIKEVSAPYTASPDLKRFWETDLRAARKTNRSTIRRKSLRPKNLPYEGLNETSMPRNHELETVMEQALQEASEDVTFQKVKRMSYSSNAAGELMQRLPHHHNTVGIGSPGGNINTNATSAAAAISGLSSLRNSKLNYDLKALDKLVSVLLEQQQDQQQNRNKNPDDFNTIYSHLVDGGGNIDEINKNPFHKSSMKQRARSNSIFNRKPSKRNTSIKLSSSPRSEAILESMNAKNKNSNNSNGINDVNVNNLNNSSNGSTADIINVSSNNNASYNRNSTGGIGGSIGNNVMPTILEQNHQSTSSLSRDNKNHNPNIISKGSWKEKARNSANTNVRNVLNSIANSVPQRFSGGGNRPDDEENINLTHNIID
ncbi:uncharacterized protein LOC129612499 [Condylostylus longicornis]|uniref:uncharacterized protein LOC129612499 n=1 Tax=Condylostylus longicornis TaxID=2530218 RepID=UPI00244DFBC6|nr:uncharacterized protein LOC129612499 [Condylostylus longicornis]XP_055382117.1 uncharacterized protein LOC129612499 [Condylostylus longicornis]